MSQKCIKSIQPINRRGDFRDKLHTDQTSHGIIRVSF
jgi:hypothetical protein